MALVCAGISSFHVLLFRFSVLFCLTHFG